MSNWVLLLPPSESKADPPGNGMTFENARKRKNTNAFRELDSYRDMVLDAVEAGIERGVGLDRLFDAKGSTLEEAVRWNRAIRTSNTLPARELYTGVMFKAIEYGDLPKDHKTRFDENTLILSGLYGLLRPTDRVAPYKLKISANLGGVVGKLTKFWRGPVSELLRQEVKGRVVWDFLPEQHRRVWDGSGEIAGRHQVKFVKRIIRDGVAEWKTISHHSKSLKGALIQHLLKKDATQPSDLFDFEHPDGFQYAPNLSVPKKREALLVFAAE